jgi:Class II flagellar assembly regulator
MVDIKGLGGIKAADRAKAKTRTGAAGGVSFADMLEDAQEVAAAEASTPASSLDLPAGFVPIEDDIPQNPRQQAQELLKTLKTLAEDAFSGSPTNTVDRLEQLANSVDESSLTTQQKDALDEARTRAAVEAAKLKS